MFEQFENKGREAISVAEFCSALGMGRATFERLDDKPKTFRIGAGDKGERLIPIKDARAWVERGFDG
jgi:hypothetical protein